MMQPRLAAAACGAILLTTAPATAFAIGQPRPRAAKNGRADAPLIISQRIRGGASDPSPSAIEGRLDAAHSVQSPEQPVSNMGNESASLSTSFDDPFDTALHKHRVLLRCLMSIVMYVALGVASFSRIFERWPVVDSLYFSVVTFTTVGYGDLVPTTEAGRLFTIFYSFAGISIVGALLGYAGGNLVEAERRAVERGRAATRARIMGLFDVRKRLRRGPIASNDGAVDTIDQSNTPRAGFMRRYVAIRTGSDGSKSLLRRALDVVAQSSYIVVPFVSLALYIGHREGWSAITSLYYAMATASTVGYGDVVPQTASMRLLSVALILTAVVSLGEILGQIAGYFIRKESEKAEREFMSRQIDLGDLEAMDTNHDGEVDLFEFLKFMLGSGMQKVDPGMMDDLKTLFISLDETRSNSLQKEDLILIAQKHNELAEKEET
ncbi:hypothetical protein ACHAXT_010895 [Thalassiosira profunda]